MKRVVVRLAGGLGNQLFQYANGLEIAKALEAKLFLDGSLYEKQKTSFSPRTIDLDYFQFPLAYSSQADPISSERFRLIRRSTVLETLAKRYLRTRTFEYRVERHFHFRDYPPPTADTVFVEGYWQSPRYFPGVADELAQQMRASKALDENSKAFEGTVAFETCLGIQVRRGDYLEENTRKFHGLLPVNFFQRALRRVAEQYSVSQVLIFSDDPDWVAENFNLHSNQSIVPPEYGQGKPAAHLLLLSRCRYLVLSNSTFGWWAAWLAGERVKEVVVPSRWFTNPGIYDGDLIPSSWTRLPNNV